MALTTAPDFVDGILTAAKLQTVSDAVNERTPLLTKTTRTSNVGTFTAETQLDSVTASLVSGYTYRVVSAVAVQSSVADGYVRGRIREDTSAGTQIQSRQVPSTIAANQSQPLNMEVFYTAVATGSKTFVATAIRQAGTGNITATAASDTVSYLYVEFVSG